MIFAENELNYLAKFVFFLFRKLHLIKVREFTEDNKDHKILKYECTNFTIINFALIIFGPKKENHLTCILLFIQVSNLFIFIVQLGFQNDSKFLYDLEGNQLRSRFFDTISTLKTILLLNMWVCVKAAWPIYSFKLIAFYKNINFSYTFWHFNKTFCS